MASRLAGACPVSMQKSSPEREIQPWCRPRGGLWRRNTSDTPRGLFRPLLITIKPFEADLYSPFKLIQKTTAAENSLITHLRAHTLPNDPDPCKDAVKRTSTLHSPDAHLSIPAIDYYYEWTNP